MSEIQSISQSNYILHNIDAKKLYVQEPLFTANSGDAVYVGWRPDETVLWETTAAYGAGVCNLSESLKNFEQIGILATRGYTGTNPGGTGPWSYWDTDGISADGADFHSVAPFIFEGYNWKSSIYSADNTYTTLTWKLGIQKAMNTTAAGTTANSFTGCVGIKKIVGINRKENA